MAGWDATNVFAQDLKLQPYEQDDEAAALSGVIGVSAAGAAAAAAGAVDGDDGKAVQVSQIQSKFRQFLRTFLVDQQFIYRDHLLANYQQGEYFLSVDMNDVSRFDPQLFELLRHRPTEFMPVFEAAAKEVVALTAVPRPNLQEMHDIQIQLSNYDRLTDIRRLGARDVSKLVCVRGIVVSSGKVKAKAVELAILCRNCRSTRRVHCPAGFGHARLPRVCDQPRNPGEDKCPLDPYMILPDATTYIDQQRLKLQESPEMVSTGEMPRHVSLSLERYLVGNVKPGTRVTVVGAFTIFQAHQGSREGEGGGGGGGGGSQAVAIRFPYIRVLGIAAENEASELLAGKFRPEDEEEMHELAKTPRLYELIANNIAPAIFGSDDIKKAITCQLFGGSRKQLPDGMRLRGDINVLLLGDPSTAKSQFLKFAVQVAPIGVYTSGKGSSAAGLTAAVIRDPSSGEFQLEGGALVLADGGLVCIDEADKMREADRVAIHEAMEQQTISIAKAGITTILNSRTSVLAAANPVFGRYDDQRTAAENIDFQSSLLSRFDMIFIVRDIQNDKRDQALARYVINVHQHGSSGLPDEKKAGDIDVEKLKKYIAYARAKVFPRLSDDASTALQNYYVKVRSDMKSHHGRDKAAIPITVRQLEAIVRLSESLARMELSEQANSHHVKEAIRLFTVSTFQAATSNFGGENLGPAFLQQAKAAEKHIRQRLPIGSRVSKNKLVKDLARRHTENAILYACRTMVQRGEMLEQAQGKLLRRLK